MDLNQKVNKKINKQYATISMYVIITAVIIYILSLVAKNIPIILVVILNRLSWLFHVIMPITLGFVISYLLNPIVDFIEAKLSKVKIRKKGIKKPRSIAVFVTIVVIMLFFVGLISLLVYSVTDQLRLANFDDLIVLAESYRAYFDNFYNTVVQMLNNLDIQSEEISSYINSASTFILNWSKKFVLGTATGVTNISSYFTTFLFAMIISIYFMLDTKVITSFLNKVGKALLKEKTNKRIHQFILDADEVFSGYIRGQLLDALFMMAAISIALSIIGVKFGLIIGILAGIGNLIPYCGPFVAYVGTILTCLLNGDIPELIIACIVLLIIQTIDGNIIGPKLLSNSIEIHPVLIIIFLIFGSAIGGLLGMLLAVPVGALIKVLFVRFIDNKLEAKEREEKNIELKDGH